MATRNFSDAELACRCGCGMLPPQQAQDWLQQVREAYGWPMVLSSGARCPTHNAAVSKTGLNGPHTVGAFDVLVWGARAHNLIEVAMTFGCTGIGVHQRGPRASRFIHLDWIEGDTRPWVWSY